MWQCPIGSGRTELGTAGKVVPHPRFRVYPGRISLAAAMRSWLLADDHMGRLDRTLTVQRDGMDSCPAWQHALSWPDQSARCDELSKIFVRRDECDGVM